MIQVICGASGGGEDGAKGIKGDDVAYLDIKVFLYSGQALLPVYA